MKGSYVVKLILARYPHLKFDKVVEQLQEGSFVSLSRRYLYVLVSKAACTTMRALLQAVECFPPPKEFDGSKPVMNRGQFLHCRENIPLPSLVDLDNGTQKQVLESPDFLRMTVVRNPYTRLVSAWKNRILICAPGQVRLYVKIKGHLPEYGRKSLISFEEFVDHIAQTDLSKCDLHWRRQVDHIFSKALNFTHIGKLERMEETLQRFQHHLGLVEPLSVGRKNTTAAGDVDFAQSLADKIYFLYQEDFEAFGYDRNAWPRPSRNGNDSRNNGMVPVERFMDEIIERNLIIYHLYQERRRLLQRTPSGIAQRIYDKFRRTLFSEGRRAGVAKGSETRAAIG